MQTWKLLNSLDLGDIPLSIVVGSVLAWIYLFTAKILPRILNHYRDPSQSVAGPISQKGLKALVAHKYQCSEYTFVDNMMNHWWIYAAKFLPLWMAPNVVTLLGWLSYIPAITCILYYGPYTVDERPWWVYLLGALGIFSYQTFDAMDGKHARATGAAGPLGQLFDHGMDAMAVAPATLLVTTALRMDVYALVIVLGWMQLSFFMAQWAERYLHTLLTSAGGIGVTEGQLLGMTVMLVAAFGGPTAWTQSVGSFVGVASAQWTISRLPVVPAAVNGVASVLSACSAVVLPKCCGTAALAFLESIRSTVLNFNFAAMSLGTVIACMVVYGCVTMTIYALTLVTQKVYRESGRHAVWKAWRELIPTLCLLLLTQMWVYLSMHGHTATTAASTTTSAFADASGSFFFNPIWSTMIVGSLFTHITCQMIISAMTQEYYSWKNQPSFIPLVVMVAFEFVSQRYTGCLEAIGWNVTAWKHLIYAALFVTSFYSQISWAVRVAIQIAELFGIHVLRVGKWTQHPIANDLREEMNKKSH